jgi:uncharacterized protein (DUF1778 family)
MADGTSPPRTVRFEARITRDVQILVKQAASLQGRSVSDFVMSAAMDAATRTIADMTAIKLSGEDALAFARALIDPPAPNEALGRAFKSHRELIGE